MWDGATESVRCECGDVFIIASPRDQLILSRNTFVRLREASNHTETGTVRVVPGRVVQVQFGRSFDFLCRAYLSPSEPILVKETFIRGDRMLVLSSHFGNRDLADTVVVTWIVYGLVEIDSLEPWYIQYYSAMTQLSNGLYKAALLEYAASFEMFLESYLARSLQKRYGMQLTEFLLRRTWRVEDRTKDLLALATGRRLTERADVYQPWVKDVRTPRNRLAHGETMSVDQDAAERAHDAVYQAIRWVQCLAEAPVVQAV